MRDADDRDEECERRGVGIDPNVPAWITPELIEQTIKVWQPYYTSPLQPDDAVTMILGVGQLFDTLRRG
jgi:hypothetical protein